MYKMILEFNKIMRYLDDIAVLENKLFNQLLYTDMELKIEAEDNFEVINKELIIKGIYPVKP